LAKFEEHIEQAKRNLQFLESINNKIENCFDWQVTVCFYTALHTVNAHLSNYNLQYRKHRDVNFALNFENRTSLAKLPEEEYISYVALQSLSRRSRYLVNDRQISSEQAFFTYDKHLAKAIRHLDILLNYFSVLYGTTFNPFAIKCSEIKEGETKFFTKNTGTK
jgi:uncharacterized protein (UPF0332 family)